MRRQAGRGLERRLRAGGLAAGHGRCGARGRGQALPRAARLRARRHRPDEVPGLLPDRLRLHPVGEGATASRSGPGAARAPARSSPGAWRSPTSTRSASACCSSASSTPSACRCRTSTSTSARTGAHEVIAYVPRPLRRGPGGADHHLRHAPGPRRAARRRPRARPAVRPGRPHLQARAAQPGQPGDAWPRRSRWSRGSRRRATRIPSVARMIDIALQLEGLPRNASTHAAGVVIGDRPLDELVPLYRDPRALMPVDPVQHEGRREGGAGQVRLPGPVDPDHAASMAERLVNERGTPLSLAALPLDDRPTYELLTRAETQGVFQLESARHARRLAQAEARQLRGHHRHGRRSIGRARWTTSRATSTSSTGSRTRATCTRCSSRSWRRPTASSSTRNR